MRLTLPPRRLAGWRRHPQPRRPQHGHVPRRGVQRCVPAPASLAVVAGGSHRGRASTTERVWRSARPRRAGGRACKHVPGRYRPRHAASWSRGRSFRGDVTRPHAAHASVAARGPAQLARTRASVRAALRRVARPARVNARTPRSCRPPNIFSAAACAHSVAAARTNADGSAGAFYFSASPTGSSEWLVYLQARAATLPQAPAHSPPAPSCALTLRARCSPADSGRLLVLGYEEARVPAVRAPHSRPPRGQTASEAPPPGDMRARSCYGRQANMAFEMSSQNWPNSMDAGA